MPYLKLQSNCEIHDSKQLITMASKFLAGLLNKPEKFVVVVLEQNSQMLFGGINDPLLYCELKSIDLPEEKTKYLSKKISDFLMDNTGVPPERIYIEFANAKRHLWGWNGSTFEK